MYLESIVPVNYGPFASKEVLRLEREVTVLTGPNDVGKSSLLRLISRVTGKAAATPQEQNADKQHSSERNYGAVVTLKFDEGEDLSIANLSKWPRGTTAARFSLQFNPGGENRVEYLSDGKATTNTEWREPVPLQSVLLPSEGRIADIISFDSPSQLETNLLRVGMGTAFEFQKLAGEPENVRETQLGRAEDELNRRLSNILPPGLTMKWHFRYLADPPRLQCALRDAHGGRTPLGWRGEGVQRITSVIAALMPHDFARGHWVILFDEPEASLHADAQHVLRRLLEELAAGPNVQVVYATHSPSMINVMRPQSLRLLKRERRNDKPTSVIENAPYKDNYVPVRASLGLTPADSLLYAPVTVVVEGDTEVIGLGLLIDKFAKAGTRGFERAGRLLSQCHFLDGMGDRFIFICQLAKSQGAKPVLFLDGDKAAHLRKQKFRDTHPDVPVVELDPGQELEQLAPPSAYFPALAEAVGAEPGQVSEEAYQAWVATPGLHERMAFTKRVSCWLGTLGLREPRKPEVMRLAIERADIALVNPRALLELLDHIERLLSHL